MFAVPPAIPVTIPDEPPMVAAAVLLLVHAPPLVASDRVVVLPWQIVVIPVIGVSKFTVTIVVKEQPPDVV